MSQLFLTTVSFSNDSLEDGTTLHFSVQLIFHVGKLRPWGVGYQIIQKKLLGKQGLLICVMAK
jgi:hypothetical protein